MKLFHFIRQFVAFGLKKVLVAWVQYVSFFSRFPGYLIFVPFPFLFLWVAFTPDVFVYFSPFQILLYGCYLALVSIYNVGSLALYCVHYSPYREPVTEFLGGGRFLFDLLGSPDPKYGNTRDHVFRTYVVPASTIGVIMSVHFFRVFTVFINTVS